jgi:hypothetical protein
MNTTQLLIVAIVLLGFLLVARAMRRGGKDARERGGPAARGSSREQRSTSTARDVEQVMLELDQLARQVHGKLDTRFAKLETIIRDADDRIDRLSRLVRESRGQTTLDVMIADDELAPPGNPVREQTSTSRDPTLLTPHGEQKRAAIYGLADEGLEPLDIAQRVGRTTGEVELILSLRKAAARGAAVASKSS